MTNHTIIKMDFAFFCLDWYGGGGGGGAGGREEEEEEEEGGMVNGMSCLHLPQQMRCSWCRIPAHSISPRSTQRKCYAAPETNQPSPNNVCVCGGGGGV